jgi:outer membrane protein assembly factor BamB
VYALNATTGAEKWTFTTGDSVSSSPAVANGVVYIGSDDGNVYALNATTGAQLWTFTTGGDVQSSPAVANGVVYADSYDGNVYAFGLAGGTEAVKRPALAQLHPSHTLRPQQRNPA